MSHRTGVQPTLPIPHDHFGEPHERREPGPKVEQTRACIPAESLGEVSGERDRRRCESERREGGKNVVNGLHFGCPEEDSAPVD